MLKVETGRAGPLVLHERVNGGTNEYPRLY